MRILITTEFYLPFQCGVTTAVINERKSLEEKGHEVRILTIYKEKVSKYEDGVYYIRSNFPQLYQDSYASLATSDPIVNDILAWAPDIVHSQCEFFTLLFAKKIARRLRIPLIHTCHTDFDSYGVHFTRSPKLWDFLTETFIPKILKPVDYVICPTKKNYDLLKSYGTENQMTIIPCGLDLSHLGCDLTEEEKIEIRAKYGLKKDDVVLVSVCRLSKEKNITESINHFDSLLRIRPDVKFLIVGDGDEREELEAQVKKLYLEKSVKFTGNIAMDEIWKYYKVGDIFISSSLSEIQGLTYIEALACSLPIICRRDHALDMSLIDGVNGFDFSSDDEFKKVILPLIDDPEFRHKIGENALRSVDKFSLDRFSDSLINIFNRQIAAKKASISAIEF